MAKPLDLIAGIEAAYDGSSNEPAWLENLAHVVGPSFNSASAPTSIFTYELDAETGAHVSSVASVGDAPFTYEHFERQHAATDVAAHRLVYEGDMFTLISRILGKENARAAIAASGTKAEDCLALRANITPTSGVMLTALAPRGYRIRNRTVWTRFAAHVGAAARLRRSQRAAEPDTALAVLTPNGKLEHGTTETVAARSDLATAAQSIDRARGKMRRLDPEAAIALWEVMVRGEWSLVDWFDHDGKRFFLAQDNRIETGQRRELTERESQVVACASMGHSNKLIAYDLGLSPGTVSVVLSRAAKKLGVSSRLALIRSYRELVASR